MFTHLLNLIKTPFNAFFKIGISEDLSFWEKKKVEIINMLALAAIATLVYFSITNYIEKRYLLVGLNLFNLFLSFLILILHNFKQYQTSRYIISFGFLICFILQAVFYKNGAEYFVFANLVASLILFSERKTIIITALVNCLAIILIEYIASTGFVYQQVPVIKVIVNTGIGVSLATVCLLYFLSQEYHHAQEIEQKNEELAILNKTKEKLFSIIAHDLRSPVALLKGSLSLISHETISKETFIKLTDQLSRQIDYMQSNLEELLLWSQSQMKGITANPRSVSLRDITEEVIELLKSQSEQKNIEIKDLIHEETIFIDPDHLKLVLRNIISNAIKFSYSGNAVEIASTQTADTLTISIKDFGIGMTEKEIEELFSESIHTTKGTAQERGTGLGLKLCKEFLSKSNSTLGIESQKGHGATFFISIPINQSY